MNFPDDSPWIWVPFLYDRWADQYVLPLDRRDSLDNSVRPKVVQIPVSDRE